VAGVCPHCGKTFKRLNSHLPHCKARDQPTALPPTRHEVTASEETPVLLSTTHASAGKMSSPPSTRLKSQSGSSLSAPEATMSRPTSPKKKTQRLAGELKMDASTPSVVPSAPLLSPSKPMNDNSSSLNETARSKGVTPGPLKQAQKQPKAHPQPMSSSDQLPAAFCPATDPVTPGTTSLSPTTRKPKGMSSQSLDTTRMSSLDSEDKVPTGGVLGRGETPSSSATFVEDGAAQDVSGAHARVTLQKAKDTLRMSKGVGVGQPVKPSLLERVRSAMPTGGEARVGGPLGASRQDATGVQAPQRNDSNGTGPLLLLTSSSSPWNQSPDATAPQARELFPPVQRVPTFHPENEGFVTQAVSSPPPTLTLTPQVARVTVALRSSPTATSADRYETSLLSASSSVSRPAALSASSSSSLELGRVVVVSGRIIRMEVDPDVNMRNLKLTNAIEGSYYAYL